MHKVSFVVICIQRPLGRI